MKGLLNNPASMSMLLGGLGLLTAKKRSQADRWKEFAARGLLSNAQALQKQRREDDLLARDQPLKDAQLEWYKAKTQGLLNPEPKQTSMMQNYDFAVGQGFKGSFLDYQKALAEAKRTSVTTNVNNIPKPPQNYMWINPTDPNQGVRPIPGSEGGKLSGEGAKLTELARGGAESVDDLEQRVESGEVDQLTMAAANLPNFMQPQSAQQFEVLRQDLADTIGRLRSGGAINKDEEKRFLNLVPRFGDGRQTIKFKMDRLRTKFENISTKVQNAPLPGEEVTTGSETLEDLLEKYGR